ncbi:MAG: hypothetical protein E5Y12_32185, partial [Mesorhizobium sp.]
KPDGPGEKFVVEGKAPAAAPGRADDFSWPPRRQPAAGATTETTTAISPQAARGSGRAESAFRWPHK